MSSNYFDSDVAASYDADVAPAFEHETLDATVDLLAEFCGNGPALELAIGTGRVGLPLAKRNIAITGIELSEAMVQEMRKKPGGEPHRIPVAIGDMTSTVVEGAGKFNLAYLVFNTIMNVTSQEKQTACFTNAARHLAPGGYFVVETMVPQLRRLPPQQDLLAFEATDKHFGVDEYNTVTQRLTSHHVFFRDGQAQHQTIPFRYVWPSELDLMAKIAGMKLHARWADWNKSPFTPQSESHVSVWQLLEA